MKPFVIISGCSGGGKSTLLAELKRRGYLVIEEPGRRIIEQEQRTGGQAMPWIDLQAFLHRAIQMSQDDYANAPADKGQWVFFDRGLIDVVAAQDALTGSSLLPVLKDSYRYYHQVFLTPPWPEIYQQDSARRHDMASAITEFDRLQLTYPALGYEPLLLPKFSVELRADFVLQNLATSGTVS